ncbi:MAG: ABC transporter ATP-binding protein [Deltaproteobacteria bacterium]|nr:ABC transporter ATP-binding protein [Deltaproteobacteria bacterium]MBW1978882.1 ABC transporter ATP-binding protein [Deltaproteobacteria bacterium]MBW2045369.1 ABC transporter ATP-binding protein [Deltaproteobacteria bacterium]MBW2299169.1 ABC transporter ATP-binding protein [Deltaproteobacteria bacterium]
MQAAIENENEMLLQVDDLKVDYQMEGAVGRAVDGVSFALRKGECIGLVGESGSGKSTIAKAILKLLPSNGALAGGRVILKGRDISHFTEEEMDAIRWAEISLVPQSAMNALNPVQRISSQMVETFLAHQAKADSRKTLLDKCQQLFEMVGLSRNRIFDYPHQFSGGMRQRATIAMAIALEPSVVIADEPTTALDVIMQAQIINLLKSLSEDKGVSIILITHDISIVAQICQRVGVMYAGRLVESGDILKVFNNPFHPYTMGLKAAFPTIKELKKTLISIPGSPPLLTKRLEGCCFSDRCPFSIEQCQRVIPHTVTIREDHYVACHRIEYAERFRKEIIDIFGTRVRGQS